jgi:hypothetical protein
MGSGGQPMPSVGQTGERVKRSGGDRVVAGTVNKLCSRVASRRGGESEFRPTAEAKDPAPLPMPRPRRRWPAAESPVAANAEAK